MRQRILAWLRSDMKVARWVFLTLYVLGVAALWGPAFLSVRGPGGMRVLGVFLQVLPLAVLFEAQGVFIVGGGTSRLCEPIRPWRLWMPVAVASFVVAVELSSAVVLAITAAARFLGLLLPTDLPRAVPYVVRLSIGGWAVLGVLLWYLVRRRRRYAALSRLAAIMFAGGVVQFLAAVPSLLSTITGPGRIGLLVPQIVWAVFGMLLGFGPMLAVVFLRPRYRREMGEPVSLCPACGYDLRGTLAAGIRTCPECGARAPDNAVALALK
jgi:hypothetical protein